MVQSNPSSSAEAATPLTPQDPPLGHPEGHLSCQAWGCTQGPGRGRWGRGWEHVVGLPGPGGWRWGSWPGRLSSEPRVQGSGPALELMS